MKCIRVHVQHQKMQHDEKKKQKDIQLHPIFVINLRTCQYEEEIGDIKGDFTNDSRVMLTQCLSQKQNKRRGKRPSPRHGNIMCPDSYQHAGLIEA